MDDSLSLDVEFIPWQAHVWQDKSRFIVIVAGRRTGKTEFAAWRLLINALTDGKKGARFYVAPTQGQARDIMWPKLLELGHGVIKNTHVNNLQVTLINGQVISLKGADRPETMRGNKLADLVVDEYADMKPYVWEEILAPATSDLEAPVLFIGTPMGRNHFYELYKYAELNGDEEWSGHHFTTYDNPYIKETEIEKAKKRMSSHAFRQEYLASFEASGSTVFKDEWLVIDTHEPMDGQWFVAVDPAGFETTGKGRTPRRDDTAIAIVKVNEQGWWVKEIRYGRWDVAGTAEQIFEAVIQHPGASIGIEKGIAQQAIMSPLEDLMRRRNRFFTIQLLTHGNQRKIDRITWALQGRMEHGYLRFNQFEELSKFLDQLYQFPDPLTADDGPDALAYIDQLATTIYGIDAMTQDEFEMLDAISGY